MPLTGDTVKEEGEWRKEEKGMSSTKTRKEKRKERKKEKRKQARREVAEKERAEEEIRLNDPDEQRKAAEMEQEERQWMEMQRKEFEERERLWLEAMERKKKQEEEEEEEHWKPLEQREEDSKIEKGEEGTAEIIWRGNEIIVRKRKMRVPKKIVSAEQSREEDADRPTSNPLPPQSGAFADFQNVAVVSAQQMLENVAQQVPNFGTEQDKAHCPFHLKTGACRFGQRCSRVHFYPDKACTLLIKNMYNGPGLAWEQDEGLEYTDEEVDCSYEEFYEDVHTEFLKYGEIVNFKVCKNGSFHLRGNVYVHYKSLDSAVLAFHSVSGRYFAGKQVKCEFVNVTRWKVAICGEFMRMRHKTCSRGTACNFLHCFRNPGGDYEWADWDKPPPRYWVKKMVALFGYSYESAHEKQMEPGKVGRQRTSDQKMRVDTDRHDTTRSRSREMDWLIQNSGSRGEHEDDIQEGTTWQSGIKDDHKRSKFHDGQLFEDNTDFESNHQSRGRSHSYDGLMDCSDINHNKDRENHRHSDHASKSSKHDSRTAEHSNDKQGRKNKSHKADFDDEPLDGSRKRKRDQYHAKNSEMQKEMTSVDHSRDIREDYRCDGYYSDRDRDMKKHCSQRSQSSIHHSRKPSPDSMSTGDGLYKDKDRERYHKQRKSSRNSKNVLQFRDDHCDDMYRTCTDSSGDKAKAEKRRHKSHTRKHSRHGEPQFSDDKGVSSKRLREKSGGEESASNKPHFRLGRNQVDRYSMSSYHSSAENREAGFVSEELKANENHELSQVDRSDGKGELCEVDLTYNPIEEFAELDRWEPESPEGDRQERRANRRSSNAGRSVTN
ncbi:hypothetical protein K2173_022201 [Erythroxylum novogranatense]|uniref:Zinc finger CCCH domain-containing protein 5 n=1 Tax=Erythroxylum novogranatense TaxID=1862640 RepID=A0AAV8STJ8_9ROSI|nr:hypothetical protein K2173_022201 [Erythroxylum novogranatense]